jgi:hypothetical protein
MSSPELSGLSRGPAAQEFRLSSSVNTLDACIFINDAFARSVGGASENTVSSLQHTDHAIGDATVDDEAGSAIKDRKAFRLLACSESLNSCFLVAPQRGGCAA